MSSYENDHPASAEPDAPSEGLSLDEILEELHETGGEGIVLVDSQGRRILGEGIVELMAGQLGRIKGGASEDYISTLPSIPPSQVKDSGEDACSICQTPFQILLDEEEHFLALDSPAIATETLGVVRIGRACEHLFCRRDASRWLSKANACPLCRQPCDPSRVTPDANISTTSSSASGQSADSPSVPESQTPAQMMQMLQDLLAGGEFPAGFGGPPAKEESRDEYSSMYS